MLLHNFTPLYSYGTGVTVNPVVGGVVIWNFNIGMFILKQRWDIYLWTILLAGDHHCAVRALCTKQNQSTDAESSLSPSNSCLW